MTAANNIKTKLEAAKKEAINKKKTKGSVPIGFFDGKDILKQYIRQYYWKKRINDLKRDIQPALRDGIKYFSFCSRYALDVRYFIKENYINFDKNYSKFGFVEVLKEDYNILKEWITQKHYTKDNVSDIFGLLSEVATDTSHENYGKFWSSFPYDVINLDYLGDILKTSNPAGKINNNDFFAIDAIIAQQSLIRRPYELWITVRAKSGRFDGSVKQSFRAMIDGNRNDFPDTFGKEYDLEYPSIKVKNLTEDNLFLLGYLKWLWFVCKRSYSVINMDKLEIIKYSRVSQNDGSTYNLYNLFFRIEPYPEFYFPSPVGDAAKFCRDEYENGIVKCFINPHDVGKEFDDISGGKMAKIEGELSELMNDFEKTRQGFVD